MVVPMTSSAESFLETSRADLAGAAAMKSASKILLVEDESLVLMLLEDMLVEMGHSIVGAASELDEAIELAKNAAYDVAIIDINLKGQRTFPVAEIVLERGLKLIFSTGYGESSIEPKFSSNPLLQKPFDDRALGDALAKLR